MSHRRMGTGPAVVGDRLPLSTPGFTRYLDMRQRLRHLEPTPPAPEASADEGRYRHNGLRRRASGFVGALCLRQKPHAADRRDPEG